VVVAVDSVTVVVVAAVIDDVWFQVGAIVTFTVLSAVDSIVLVAGVVVVALVVPSWFCCCGCCYG